MAILDASLELTDGVDFDLKGKGLGTGEPITLAVVGAAPGTRVTIFDQNDLALARFDPEGDHVQFTISTNTDTILRPDFASGSVYIVLDAQTNS